MAENQHLNPRQTMNHSVAPKTTTQRTAVLDEVTGRRLYLDSRALFESTNHNATGQSVDSTLPPKLMKPLRYATNVSAHDAPNDDTEEAPLGWSQEAWEQQGCQNQMQQGTASRDIRNDITVVEIVPDHQPDNRSGQSDHVDEISSSKAPSNQAKTAIVAGLRTFSPIVLQTTCSSKNNAKNVKKIRHKGTCTVQFARWRRKNKRQKKHGRKHSNSQRNSRSPSRQGHGTSQSYAVGNSNSASSECSTHGAECGRNCQCDNCLCRQIEYLGVQISLSAYRPR